MKEQMITTLSGSIGAGLSCSCPRCGKGKLFRGFLTLQPRCEHCGLDYTFADSGDGPAVFIMFLAGAVVVGAALITEIMFHPPYWVHAALWLPITLLGFFYLAQQGLSWKSFSEAGEVVELEKQKGVEGEALA